MVSEIRKQETKTERGVDKNNDSVYRDRDMHTWKRKGRGKSGDHDRTIAK